MIAQESASLDYGRLVRESKIPLFLMSIVALASTREWLGRVQQPIYLAVSYAIVMFGVWSAGPRFVYFAF